MKMPVKLLFALLIFPAFLQPVKAQDADIKIADSLYNLQQWKKALPFYEKAITANSQDPLIYSKAGFCNYNLGNTGIALKYYQQAISYKIPAGPNGKAAVEMRMARAYAKMKEPEKAFQFIDSAFTHGYPDLTEFETLEEFAKLRNTQKYKEQHDSLFKWTYPCSADPKKREFDFWVGEWDVYNPSNILVGHSLIQKITGECTILENWISLRGGTYDGKSMNYYDPEKGSWKQLWMGSFADISFSEEGEYVEYTSTAMPAFKGYGMRFKRKDKDRKGEFIANFVFFNLGPDKIRQFLEKSYDGGKTWVVGLNLMYVRKNIK